MEKKNTKACGWVCTLHNLTKTDAEYLLDFKAIEGVKYFKGQRERGEGTSKEHLQYFIDFVEPVYFTTVQKLVHPTTHIEQRKARKKTDAVNYCCKEETRVGEVMEFGVFVEDRSRTDLMKIIEDVRAGRTNSQILENYPTQFFRYKKHIESVRRTIQESQFEDTFRTMTVIYIHGSPRSGKTRYILEKYGYRNVCRVTQYDKWLFENYYGQKIVLFDEFIGQPKITEMNDYLDGYPYQYRCRNEDRVAMNDTVVIISNLKLSEQYIKDQTERPKVYEAFTKRIHHVIDWDDKSEREHFVTYGTNMQREITQTQFIGGGVNGA